MSTSKEARFTRVRGDVFRLALVLTSDDGSPYDLTGMSLRAQLRRTLADTAVEATFAVTIDPDPETGKAWVELTSAQTEDLALGGHVFDVRRDDGPETVTLVRGSLQIIEAATR